MVERVSKTIDKQDITIETGKLAKQADGSVMIQMGGTVVLVTAVCSRSVREGMDFLPLTVEYQEKTYAAGKIPGGFFKREGRPSEKAILTSRLIDRPIRPLFPKGMVNDIQVIATVLSTDGENDSDVLAVNGASTALSISDIPFDGPIGCVRVGLIEGEFFVNPTFEELETSLLNILVVGQKNKTIMVEAEAKEIEEEKIEEAIIFGQKHIDTIIELQKELIKKVGRKKRTDIVVRAASPETLKKVKDLSLDRLKKLNTIAEKEKRQEALNAIKDDLIEKLVTEGGPEEWEVKNAFEAAEKETVRDSILKSSKRIDGRSHDEVRSIECVVGLLPRTHGSGLFTRGQTQALCVSTLGTSNDEQRIDALEGETHKTFMLHYNFPPFSVGEAKPMRGPGRREIGHGALAEKALRPVMPSKDDFPYTVRIVADILESNGSSSMASVCAGSLSMMDAGVPTKAPVAGIAIGLVEEGGKYVLLTDIAGLEDHYGDMDFKVAGTEKGITAVQMDLKIKGIDKAVIKEAFQKAKTARLGILKEMNATITGPKGSISEFAPKIINIKVNPEKIKDIIGPGGKMIKQIIRDTGVTINVDDDGNVQVASSDEAAIEKALTIIKGLSANAEVGKIYDGKITRLMNFGAFCEILPGKEGLIHVSELADKFVKDVESVVKVGDRVKVKVIEIDGQRRINLSRKQAMESEGEKSNDSDKEKK